MEMEPSNCMNIPFEAIELRYPLRIRQYSLCAMALVGLDAIAGARRHANLRGDVW